MLKLSYESCAQLCLQTAKAFFWQRLAWDAQHLYDIMSVSTMSEVMWWANRRTIDNKVSYWTWCNSMALCSSCTCSFCWTATQEAYHAGQSLVLYLDYNCSSRCSSQAIPGMNCNCGNIVGHALEAWTHRDLDLQTLAENPDKHEHNTDILSFHVHTCASFIKLLVFLTDFSGSP